MAWASGWEPEEPEAVTGAPACSTSGSGSTLTEGLTEPFPDLPPLCLEDQTSEYRRMPLPASSVLVDGVLEALTCINPKYLTPLPPVSSLFPFALGADDRRQFDRILLISRS